MAYEHLKDSALPRALSDVIADLADLLQKEMRLARAELSSKLSLKLRGGVWVATAGVLALIAGLLVIEAAVFGLASFGIALHWSCLIVAAIIAVAAATAYALGRSDLAAPLTPDRSIRQLKKDVTAAREQVS